ncbi:MAG: FliI/YscN family ATPase [Ignavibacteria bacterium]|nr:FliI/YscN family ATPase [Ignavibacteria bacterium]
MINPDLFKKKALVSLRDLDKYKLSGKATKVVGLVVESEGPKAPIGEICILKNKEGQELSKVEIVGFKNNTILSMILGDLSEVQPGMELVATGEQLSVSLGDSLLGRVLDGMGEPLDDLGRIIPEERRSIYALPPHPLTRQRIREPLSTGIKAIDGLLTIGKGQRVGIFAGSGIGKSTLLGMIARNTSADINVIALIGERGREVKEFIEDSLGEAGIQRSILVVATSDAVPLVRVKAALVATTIAEFFRDKGLDVLLMMDSATRLAMAQREVGLSIGEPPTSRGYTPSVFTLMQKAMERSGNSEIGSITGLYTVLVEGDDMNEPVSDAARGILDGHIVLTRRLASFGHYPAIDVLESISRVMNDVISPEHKKAAKFVKEMMATYRGAEDLISVGAYQKGSNPRIDKAIKLNDIINGFLTQATNEAIDFDELVNKLISIANAE